MSNELAKKIRIMTDLIMPHNKWHSNNANYVLNNIDEFNIPKLVEKTIAKLGNHKVVDGYGYDLDDGSEVKTSTVSENWTTATNNWSYRKRICRITNVATSNGKRKKGALRVVVYNQFTDELRYFFLPQKVWKNFNLYRSGGSSTFSIKFSYSINDDMFSVLSDYEVDSLAELATAINC